MLGNAVPCTGGGNCAWALENWGGGWVFSPDYYPTGEEIFSTGAGSNSGSYSNATNDANIEGEPTPAPSACRHVPELPGRATSRWCGSPTRRYALSEISNKLHGATPQNVFGYLTPENWYFTK